MRKKEEPKSAVSEVLFQKQQVSFILSLKRDILKWKFALAACVILLLFFLGSGGSGSGNAMPEKILFSKVKLVKSDFIAEVALDGVIMPDKIRDKMFDELINSPRVKAVLITINSPGGSLNGSEVAYNKIKELGEKKPIVTLIGEMGASGGYMAAIASDHIIANKTSMVGSIGVRMDLFKLEKLMQTVGVEYESYATTQFKANPNPFQKTPPEVAEYVREGVAESMDFFKSLVAERRNLSGEKLERVANAKVFTGMKALEYGLIDEIGDRKTALNFLQRKGKDLEALSVVEIVESDDMQTGLMDKLLRKFFSKKAQIEGPKILAKFN